MTPLQSNVLKLIAGCAGFGLLAWMDYAGIKDPDLRMLVIQAMTTVGIVHVLGSSSK